MKNDPWLRRLDPRLHFAAAIGWAVFIVVTLAALLTAELMARQAESRARAEAEALLGERATEVRDVLSLQLETRLLLLQATAAQIAAAGERGAEGLQRSLQGVREPFPEFAWLGVVDPAGRLRAQAGSAGDAASAPAWFDLARNRPFVSDARALPPAAAERTLDFAVPLDPASPQATGVLAARLSWSWIDHLLAKMQSALDAQHRLEVILLARDGSVLSGPPDAAQGADYVAGVRSSLRLADGLGLGWTAIVRQRADQALAPAVSTRRTVFLTIFIAGLLSAAAAVLVTRWLAGRLARLAADAEAVRRGDRRLLAVPSGVDEVSRIGATLAEVVDHLQREKQALQTLNAELDQRVAERTRRIERLADESRHAAVTRERLRIARDLHDTLAHSLMALLTQLRLIRKLRTRLPEQELDAELGRAEDVAATGLAEARSAITQMRGNDVRDAGLGPALHDLVRRFGQRSGVAATLQVDAAAATWAGERAETVFRIVEEALRNVERHAQARQVGVCLQWSDGDGAAQVKIEVSDDGIGFDPERPQPGHYGLRGIHEQAQLIAARLAIRSASGEGTRVTLELAA